MVDMARVWGVAIMMCGALLLQQYQSYSVSGAAGVVAVVLRTRCTKRLLHQAGPAQAVLPPPLQHIASYQSLCLVSLAPILSPLGKL